MKSSSIRKFLPHLTIIMVILLLALILPVNMIVQMYMTHNNQQTSSAEIFWQLENLIEINQHEISIIKEEFNEKIIQSAEMAAYFVEHTPEVVLDLEHTKQLAENLGVDELHYFNPEGELYFGTHPQYYGYTFNSGEQMQFFLPMLDDKSLKLCQDITPNTAEGKYMQYAAVWMDDGSGIIQVGIQPERLMAEIENKSLTNIMNYMPFDMRGFLHVYDKTTHKIIASTKPSLIGMDVGGISEEIDRDSSQHTLHTTFDGERYCVYLHDYDKYVFIRTYLSLYPRQEVAISSILVLLYIAIAASAVIMIIIWYIDKKLVHNLTSIINSLKNVETGNMERINLNTRITEYDELISYINQMLDSIRLNWNKLIYIIDKSHFPVGIFEYNGFYKKTFTNVRLLDILGIPQKNELSSSDLSSLVKGKLTEAQKHIIDKDELIYEYDKNGVPVCLRIETVADEQSITYYVSDVSVWWNELDQLRDESLLDFLTSLYNRKGFYLKLNKLFDHPEKLGYGAIIMIDADNLKKTNDIYGHHVGDEYLKQISKHLHHASGVHSVCSRLGGDEFVIFLYGYSSVQQLQETLTAISDIRGKPFVSGSMESTETLEFSMGIASYPDEGSDYHHLMHIADEKMYNEKIKRRFPRRTR